MQRREALKLITGAAVLPVLSRDVFALFREAHQQLPAAPALKTLNPHQNATVTTIADLIIPQTDTPGAKAARVNEFIDLILTEWCDESQRNTFLAGLADVDARSRTQYGKDFVDCSESQQKDILTELDEEVTTLREKRLPAELGEHFHGPLEGHFFFRMKRLTLVGYYTSEIGDTQELKTQSHFSRYQGCAPLVAGTQGN